MTPTTDVPPTDTLSAPGKRRRGLRPGDVAELTAASAFPSISVLLPTEPAARMTTADAERLDELVREVRRQLTAAGVLSADRLMARLTEQADRVRRQPTERALAVYVNLAVARVFRLTAPVFARAVVEQTFATRALVEELHRTPPYVVLVLDATSARLYQMIGGAVRAAGHRDLFREAGDPRDDDAQAAFLDDVDAMLGAYRERHPSPLVLAGAPEQLDRFETRSRHLHRLAGRVPSERAETARALWDCSAELLESYLRSRRLEAMASLQVALEEAPRDVARGLAECWTAVHRTRPLMLCVEQGYVSPAEDEAGRSGRHDLVDDLMELVILRGGQLAIVADGDLADHGRVALLSRSIGGRAR